MENGKEEPKLDLLIKLLMMTTSNNDGEALSAMRKANSVLALRVKSDWDSLLRGKVTIVEDPFNSIATPTPTPAPQARPAPPPPLRPTPRPAPAPKAPADPFAGLTPIYAKNTYHIRDKIRTLPGSRYDAKQRVWYVSPHNVQLVRDWLSQLGPKPKRSPASVADLADDLGI